MHLQNSRKELIKLRKLIHEKEKKINNTATREKEAGKRTLFLYIRRRNNHCKHQL